MGLLLLAVLSKADVPLPAFPGAGGFGAIASGGRGGEVIHVTAGDAPGHPERP